MVTRSGDLDPSVVTEIMDRENLTAKEANSLLNKKSGLYGISGLDPDFREIETASSDPNHPKAKIAKDVAAGGVVITAVNALIVAYFLFFDKISDIGLNFIRNLANSPVHMAFIGIFLIIILIVTLKAASSTNKHKFFKNLLKTILKY